MYPAVYAAKNPEKAACIMASSSQVVTYRELNERSNRFAQFLWHQGLRPDDHMAFFLENHPRFFELTWGAHRSGIYYTAINFHLTASEVAYIVNDCGASVFITSLAKTEVATRLRDQIPQVRRRLSIGGKIEGYECYEEVVHQYPAEPIPAEMEGAAMLYSSGTTGRPKGVKRLLARRPIGHPTPINKFFAALYHFDEHTIYLSPAPLYHAAPLGFTMNVQRYGGTVVVMERFDPVEALRLIERYRITHSQWVPTMFIRMLRLPPEERTKYDLSSLQFAIHAAAPCPVPVKEQMMEWWGPILYEYYGGTEGNGGTAITPGEWLQHKGSVGRAFLGELHIVGEDGEELPPGKTGLIYFANGPQFEYHNDPMKTRASRNERGWTTIGDIGYVDKEGYLYLTDRRAHMIISGGVNIYPQEAENVLATHPKVMDVAVFGVPNDEFGEEVKAVVQPVNMTEAGPALAQELIDYCKQHLATYKCPRTIDFEAELPRSPTGKLYKRLLRDRYWTGHQSKIL